MTLSLPVLARAQSDGWYGQLNAERSWVTNQGADTIWSAQTLAFGLLKAEAGGFRVFGERQMRGDLVDGVFGASGYRRLGDWTIAGGAAGSADASFWFRQSVEAELHRRVVGTWVASAGYRFMAFPSADVHQVQPAITYYNPRGEVQLRAYATHNATLDRTTWAGLLRTTMRLDPHFTLVAAVAGGDRIFDIASLALDSTAESWTVRAGLRIDLTRKDQVEIGGGFAGENPGFRQRTLAASYRRVF